MKQRFESKADYRRFKRQLRRECKRIKGTFYVRKNNEDMLGGTFAEAKDAAKIIEAYGHGNRVEVIIHIEHKEMGPGFSSSASQ